MLRKQIYRNDLSKAAVFLPAGAAKAEGTDDITVTDRNDAVHTLPFNMSRPFSLRDAVQIFLWNDIPVGIFPAQLIDTADAERIVIIINISYNHTLTSKANGTA